VNITKARLEGLFVDELERFQPTPGYMRLLKESVLRVWHDRKASVKNEVASAEHRAKAIEQKLDRLNDAFIYKESIDLGTYERQRDRLREELTLIEIDRHGSKLDELDVENLSNEVHLLSKESTMVQGQYSTPRVFSGSGEGRVLSVEPVMSGGPIPV